MHDWRGWRSPGGAFLIFSRKVYRHARLAPLALAGRRSFVARLAPSAFAGWRSFVTGAPVLGRWLGLCSLAVEHPLSIAVEHPLSKAFAGWPSFVTACPRTVARPM